MKQWNNHFGEILDKKNDYEIIECEYCGFKHMIPLVTAEKSVNYYKEKFLEDIPNYAQRLIEDYEWWNLVHDEKYDYLEQFTNSNQRSLLDIGCGFGYFLLRGKQRGWKVKGIDPARKAVSFAREKGLDVEEGLISESMLPGQYYDVIHMHEVLEHLPDPITSLKIIKEKLHPKGLVCIDSPNDYNPLQIMLKNNLDFEPWWIVPPIHVNYFNLQSMIKLLTKTGFEVVYSTSTFPLEFFLLMGDNYIGNDKKGREIHGKRKKFEANFHQAGMEKLRREIYKSLSKLGIGREFVVIAKVR